ncbi:unnamed protein product [Brachionus calyciflorus]|uniref:BEN domain-containing protein n=1 Tax=Brachionus calyciflorus TaxID=104777 RepID=A0A813XL44_9BILA|nr:unnamed protein product [Brachionus calyciflorus]
MSEKASAESLIVCRRKGRPPKPKAIVETTQSTKRKISLNKQKKKSPKRIKVYTLSEDKENEPEEENNEENDDDLEKISESDSEEKNYNLELENSDLGASLQAIREDAQKKKIASIKDVRKLEKSSAIKYLNNFAKYNETKEESQKKLAKAITDSISDTLQNGFNQLNSTFIDFLQGFRQINQQSLIFSSSQEVSTRQFNSSIFQTPLTNSERSTSQLTNTEIHSELTEVNSSPVYIPIHFPTFVDTPEPDLQQNDPISNTQSNNLSISQTSESPFTQTQTLISTVPVQPQLTPTVPLTQVPIPPQSTPTLPLTQGINCFQANSTRFNAEISQEALIVERRNRIFDRAYIQRLREQRISTPNFATKLLMFFFDQSEMIGNVNVEGNILNRKSSREALDTVRVNEIRRLVLDGRNNEEERKKVWTRCRDAMNKKISEIKKLNNF